MGKKVYLSGPISGLRLSHANFKEAAKFLHDDGYTVLNPMDIKLPSSKIDLERSTWNYYMREGLKMLLCADCIYMLAGWEGSKGARIEFNLAVDLKLSVRYQPKEEDDNG